MWKIVLLLNPVQKNIFKNLFKFIDTYNNVFKCTFCNDTIINCLYCNDNPICSLCYDPYYLSSNGTVCKKPCIDGYIVF